jgi:PAS domain S-box-containing protein
MKPEEAALRASERTYRSVVDSLAEMVCRFRMDGTILFVNAAYAVARGTTAPALTGGNFWAFVQEGDRPAVRAMLERLTPETPEVRIENRFETTGGERWTLWTNRALAFDAAGRVLEAQSSGIDITERKAAEQALRESEARKSAMLETALDCIISIDHQGRVVEFNPAAERTFGYRREEALGTELAELIVPPALRARHRQGLARHLATGEGTVLGRRVEMPAMRADGTELPVELAIARIPGEGPPLFTAYLRDITERKRSEDALREADRAKDEFLATLSHELRNPLAPLRNALHLLRHAGAAPGSSQVLEMMERQVNHLVRLVDDLMEMSRIARGSFELRREPVELQAVLRNALETAEPLIAAAQHHLSVSLPEKPIALEADPVRLAQVFANLLNNAAKYTPAGGSIALEARREGGEAVVSVADTGQGIDAAQLPRIFDMFTQGERTSRHSQGGLGIGLALARRLAQMHGGSVRAHSEGRGKGSRFSVRLPLGKPSGPARAEQQSTHGMAPRRVLVVDDNRDAANSLGMLLSFLGADVAVAHDGPGALQAFDAYRPAIVVLDIGMPGMNGYDVARAIRARPGGEKVPLIALTGWGQVEDRRRAKEAGFDHHLIKPADVGALQVLLGSFDEPRSP